MFVSNYSDDTTKTRMSRSYTIESTAKTQALELGGFVCLRRGCFDHGELFLRLVVFIFLVFD